MGARRRADDADAVLVNTCGFVESAKKDSVDTLLGRGRPRTRQTEAVVAVGCMAERYGAELAAGAARGRRGARLRRLRRHRRSTARVARRRAGAVARPADRRTAAAAHTGRARRGSRAARSRRARATPWRARPGPGAAPPARTAGPVAPLKLASGCDRRCTSARSRRSAARSCRGRRTRCSTRRGGWPTQGVRELVLVSENSTSYGKDLGDLRAAGDAAARSWRPCDGIERVRVSYLQPAETAARPGRGDRDHARRRAVLRPVLPARERGRCCGGCGGSATTERVPRAARPRPRARSRRRASRSNVIVGFPGETEDDVAELERFLVAARLDAVGVFGYSDEDGTEAADARRQGRRGRGRRRVEHGHRARRGAVGTARRGPGRRDRGRAGRVGRRRRRRRGHGPRTRGPRSTATTLAGPRRRPRRQLGDMVAAVVVDGEGVDLVAARVPGARSASRLARVDPAGAAGPDRRPGPRPRPC